MCKKARRKVCRKAHKEGCRKVHKEGCRKAHKESCRKVHKESCRKIHRRARGKKRGLEQQIRASSIFGGHTDLSAETESLVNYVYHRCLWSGTVSKNIH